MARPLSLYFINAQLNGRRLARLPSVQDYKRDFINLCLQHQVLRFGEFTLKSGRRSPYFFNAGLFNSAASMSKLGECYAKALRAQDLHVDILFGPAYKGIPLACAMAIAAHQYFGLDFRVCFDRKEAKDHGEGGLTFGAPLTGRVLIVDDVISAGTSIRHSLELIKSHNATCVGALIALDRQERGVSTRSAVQEIEQDYGIPVFSIISLSDLLAFLDDETEYTTQLAALQAYRSQYGIAKE
jgi:orotate phosphoribosyltransferase